MVSVEHLKAESEAQLKARHGGGRWMHGREKARPFLFPPFFLRRGTAEAGGWMDGHVVCRDKWMHMWFAETNGCTCDLQRQMDAHVICRDKWMHMWFAETNG